MITIQDLPFVNALLNSASAFCVVAALVYIKNGKKDTHRNLMMLALFFSACFLTSYLIYHYHVGSKKFPDLGYIRVIYLGILLTHTVLAVAVLPLVGATVYNAARKRWDTHRRYAKWAYPVWIYVSVTGVIIYLMLYHWFAL